MFGILVSAFNVVLAFVLRKSVITFGIAAAMYFIVHEFAGVLVAQILPGDGDAVTQLNNVFGSVPASIWWGLDLFRADYGVPLILSAHVTKFIIRRIPFIN